MNRFYAIFFWITVFLVPSLAIAQNRPQWVTKLPRPTNDTYEYKMEKGYGSSELEARNAAIGRIFQGISFYLGAKASSYDVNQAVQKGENFDVIAEYFDIPVNKVCEYAEKIDADTYMVCVLCQVAKVGNRSAEFDFFAECDKKAKNPYVGYAFVPGMAQSKKGSVTKGALFITGEVVCIGGIVVSECLRSSYVSKANSTRDVNLRKNYTDYATNAAISRNVFIAATAAVYVWNVIDGIVAKGKPQLAYNGMEMRFAPYLDVVNQAGGLALNMRF